MLRDFTFSTKFFAWVIRLINFLAISRELILTVSLLLVQFCGQWSKDA